MGAERPMCAICGQHPVSQKKAAACHSPKCKRQLAEERAAMRRVRKHSDEKMSKAYSAITNPEKVKRELASEVRRFMQYGFTDAEAVWRVARQSDMTPAEVLLAYRAFGDAA